MRPAEIGQVNAALVFAYKVVAAGLHASEGILLAPAVGAIFMSASTIIVAANAQLLRGLKL